MRNFSNHLFTYGTLIIVGVSSSLVGDPANTITGHLASGDGARQVCQGIGKKGQLLATLPGKTKDSILKKCEFELLGIDRKYSSEELDYADDIKQATINPHAWKASMGGPLVNLDAAAQQRIGELQQLREQRGSSAEKTMHQQKTREVQDIQQINEVLKKYITLGKVTDLQPLAVDATCERIKKMYRKLALVVHPDKGGDEEDFKYLSAAYERFNTMMCQ